MDQQVRQISVVPALYSCSNRPSPDVEAVRRDDSALLIDENLDSADGGAEGLLHAEPVADGFLIVEESTFHRWDPRSIWQVGCRPA